MRIPEVGNHFACLQEMVTRPGQAVGEAGMGSSRGAGKDLELSFVIFFGWLAFGSEGFWWFFL